jgi:hypothetical protein
VPPKMDPNCQSRINPAYVQWKAEQQRNAELQGQRKHLAHRAGPEEGLSRHSSVPNPQQIGA